MSSAIVEPSSRLNPNRFILLQAIAGESVAKKPLGLSRESRKQIVNTTSLINKRYVSFQRPNDATDAHCESVLHEHLHGSEYVRVTLGNRTPEIQTKTAPDAVDFISLPRMRNA
jgi:hypothetical protein